MSKTALQTAMSEIPFDDHLVDRSDSSGDDSSSIIAIASTVDTYRYENGRRYHAYRDGSYWAPNDDLNSATEKVTHHVFLRAMKDKLHLAPVNNPQRIVDLGCGLGLWTMDIADLYEDAEVLGIDLSPIPPTAQPNVRYEIDDIASEWTYGQTFDFIHMRHLYGSIENWDHLYQQCFESMEVGGYIEHVEYSLIPHSVNGPIPENNVVWRWIELAEKYMHLMNKSLFVGDTMKADIQRAGFVDVVERRLALPVGTWSSDENYKSIGKWFKQVWWTGMEGWILSYCTRYEGWTVLEVQDFVQNTKRELDTKSKHYYYEAVVVYGRKP